MKIIIAAFIILPCLSNSVSAEGMYFSGEEFHEPVDAEYWKHHPRIGIEVQSFLDMSYVKFRHLFFFDQSDFYFGADFSRAQFESSVVFSGAQFYSAATFEYAYFDDVTDFSGAQFDSTADFSSSRFNSKAEFDNTQFDSSVDFGQTQFDSNADFNRARFASKASFKYAHFDSAVVFSGAKFHSKADFREARFAGNVIFRYATLPDSLDFREVIDIAKEINFTSAYPPDENKKCRIALAGADIDKIKINMRLFELWFPADTSFIDSLVGNDPIKVIHRIFSPRYDEKTSVYESVLKNLKDDGLMDSYQILDIEYREFKYRHQGGLNWYVANTFHRWWWNYGYAKELIFLWTLGFLFLFSVLNINFYRRLSENVYAIPFLGKWDNNSMRWPKSWIYYWLQVVTYTAIIFFGLKMDIAKFKEGVVRNHPLLFAYLMFIYVLGLVCLGFIANIIFTR